MIATTLYIVKPVQSVTHLEQISATCWFGCDWCLSRALEATQSEACPNPSQTRRPEIELGDGQKLGRVNETFDQIK